MKSWGRTVPGRYKELQAERVRGLRNGKKVHVALSRVQKKETDYVWWRGFQSLKHY